MDSEPKPKHACFVCGDPIEARDVWYGLDGVGHMSGRCHQECLDPVALRMWKRIRVLEEKVGQRTGDTQDG